MERCQTEKSELLKNLNKVVLSVPFSTTKGEIRSLFRTGLSSALLSVNTLLVRGKEKRTAKGRTYKRGNWKKAVVTFDKPVDVKLIDSLLGGLK